MPKTTPQPKKHLHRYLAEFDFRYSNRIALGVNDPSRAARALTQVVGKRLMKPENDGHKYRSVAEAFLSGGKRNLRVEGVL